MELKETNHSYYCADSNFYVGNQNGEEFGQFSYDSWEAFQEAWLMPDCEHDDDYNHVFRFDIEEEKDEEDNSLGNFSLKLYFILQRKGIFRPVEIKNITEDDLPAIETFLKERWSYLKKQWIEFSS